MFWRSNKYMKENICRNKEKLTMKIKQSNILISLKTILYTLDRNINKIKNNNL